MIILILSNQQLISFGTGFEIFIDETKTPIMQLISNDDENLLFLKQKISSIRFAIFKAEINSEVQLPNNIIETLKVENDGTLWFLTSCTGEHAKTVDRSFYAYLDFYRKGTDCRLQLSGNATIVEDDDQDLVAMSNYSKGLSKTGRLVLVRMKIMQAEYHENKRTEPTGSIVGRLKTVFNHLFLSNPDRTYNFSS